VFIVLSLVVRLSVRQQALAIVSRRSHRWIIEWASHRPILQRLLARRILGLLGYRGQA
jgi:hypothetical protein